MVENEAPQNIESAFIPNMEELEHEVNIQNQPPVNRSHHSLPRRIIAHNRQYEVEEQALRKQDSYLPLMSTPWIGVAVTYIILSVVDTVNISSYSENASLTCLTFLTGAGLTNVANGILVIYYRNQEDDAFNLLAGLNWAWYFSLLPVFYGL